MLTKTSCLTVYMPCSSILATEVFDIYLAGSTAAVKDADSSIMNLTAAPRMIVNTVGI